MDRRRFLLTSLAGVFASPYAAEGLRQALEMRRQLAREGWWN